MNRTFSYLENFFMLRVFLLLFFLSQRATSEWVPALYEFPAQCPPSHPSTNLTRPLNSVVEWSATTLYGLKTFTVDGVAVDLSFTNLSLSFDHDVVVVSHITLRCGVNIQESSCFFEVFLSNRTILLLPLLPDGGGFQNPVFPDIFSSPGPSFSFLTLDLTGNYCQFEAASPWDDCQDRVHFIRREPLVVGASTFYRLQSLQVRSVAFDFPLHCNFTFSESVPNAPTKEIILTIDKGSESYSTGLLCSIVSLVGFLLIEVILIASLRCWREYFKSNRNDHWSNARQKPYLFGSPSH